MRVYLDGYLGNQFGREHDINISCPTEAIRAFNANYPSFLSELRKGEFKILHNNTPFVNHEQLHMQYNNGSLHIVPVPTGSKSKFFQVFIGAVLIAAAFYTGGTSLAAWGAMQTGMALAGTGLILGAFLAPTVPDYSQRESPEERPSYLFNGATNTTEQGGPIPILYGRLIVGSKVVSAELDCEDIDET